MGTGFKSGLVLAIAAVTATALVTGCGSKNDQKTPSSGSVEKVQVMMFPGQAYRLPVVIANEQGFFKNHGIEVSIVAQPNNLQGAQAMIATKSQVGQLSTPTLAQGVENGSPVAFFCGGVNVVQTTLFAKKGSSIKSVDEGATWQEVLKSLSGKKVGVQTPVGSGLQLLFAGGLKDEGITNVTYINVGGGNNVTLAALDNGSVDVAQVNPTGTQRLVHDGSAKPLMYLPSGPEAYNLYGSAWTGQTSWLKEKPKAAKGFCDAIGEALTFIKDPAHADAAAQALAKDTALDPSVASLVVKEVYKDFSTDLPNDVLTKTLGQYREYGITKSDLSSKEGELVQVPKP